MSSINATRSRFGHHRERGLSVRDASGVYRIVRPAEILQAAQEVLAARLVHTPVLDAPSTVKDYLRVKLGTLEHEVFGVVFLTLCGCLRNVQRAGEALAPQAFPAPTLHITDLTVAATIR